MSNIELEPSRHATHYRFWYQSSKRRDTRKTMLRDNADCFALPKDIQYIADDGVGKITATKAGFLVTLN